MTEAAGESGRWEARPGRQVAQSFLSLDFAPNAERVGSVRDQQGESPEQAGHAMAGCPLGK